MNALGARIKALRRERGLLQKDLADKAGLTASMMSQIESGRLTPTLPTLGKLASALGISIPELLEPPTEGRRIHIRVADPRRMKWSRLAGKRRHRGRPSIGAMSPYISWTRSSASTPDCRHRSTTGERAF